MTTERKEQIIKGVASLVAAGVVISLTKGGPGSALPCLTTFIAGTVGNWAATLSFDSLLPTFKRFWLDNSDENVNHHINRALTASWGISLDELLINYIHDHPDVPQRESLSLIEFINELKGISGAEFMRELSEDRDHEEIFSYASSDADQITQFLNTRFHLSDRLNAFSEQYVLTQHFIAFFIRELPKAFNFHFRIELKTGKEAKQAMDLLYFQTIKDLVSQISRIQTVQLDYLKTIDQDIKNSFEADVLTRDQLIGAVNQVSTSVTRNIEIVREKLFELGEQTTGLVNGQGNLLFQMENLNKQMEFQRSQLGRLSGETPLHRFIQVDDEIKTLVLTKGFFKNLNFTGADLLHQYEAVEQEIKLTLDEYLLNYLSCAGARFSERHTFYLNGKKYLLQSLLNEQGYLLYNFIPEIYLPENMFLNNRQAISSIGLIKEFSLQYPKNDILLQALLTNVTGKLHQIIYQLYEDLESLIKKKVRTLESMCIHGIRQLIQDELKRNHIAFAGKNFNFTVTYLQRNDEAPCCYQLDYESLVNLIDCLKALPHPYYSAFTLILGFTSMNAPDEFIFRYREKMHDGVTYDNMALSLLFSEQMNNYHIIYEVEKLFYSSDHLFNIEICRYNDYVLEVTMDHQIKDFVKQALLSLKDDIYEQFRENIDLHQGALAGHFFRNFNLHGNIIKEKIDKYLSQPPPDSSISA